LQGLPPSVMPTKRELVSANRNDLARVVERYGGLYELAQMLNFEVGWCPSRQMRGPPVCGVPGVRSVLLSNRWACTAAHD